MNVRRTIVLALAAAAALFAFHFFIRRVSLISFNLAGTPEVRQLLVEAMEDEKRLARLDPARRDHYRRRFERMQAVNRKLDIVALNREEIARRYETALVAVVGVLLLAFVAGSVLAGARRERRLLVIRRALEALGRGETDVTIGDRSRDAVGRIAAMIETTSRDIARDRRRIQYLDHLESWQEAARRHAHEIRTPLTAARLEIDSFIDTVAAREPSLAGEAAEAQASIHEELDRLREFTRQFTSFGRIGVPQRELHDLQEAVEDFISLFSGAWPHLALKLESGDTGQAGLPVLHPMASFDRDMVRQVLVNLCNNSSLAGATCVAFRITEARGLLQLDVADDGPGVDPAIRPRLFQPYTTTRAVGEGMGLGLAICRKIMLDHGGDLEFLDAPGAVFRITLPRAARA